MQVAFLGLGAIGTPMAARLASRFPLTVWNRTAERARAFAREHGAKAVATPREAAEGADIVITCFPISADVAALLPGPDGLGAGLKHGSLLVDCTSGDPATSQRMAAELAAEGIGYLDAPVSGGTNGAAAGTLTVMVGGDTALVERARPVLAAFGSRIEAVGPVGAGAALKAVNNALLAVNILACGEGVTALVKAGVPARKALEVINASSGRSFVSETLIPERVLTGAWPRTFRLALLAKDVNIATGVVHAADIGSPMLDLAAQLLRDALGRLTPDADYLDPIQLKENESGALIRG